MASVSILVITGAMRPKQKCMAWYGPSILFEEFLPVTGPHLLIFYLKSIYSTAYDNLYDVLLGLFTDQINTLRPRQNERHFAYDIFKCIFLNENVWISIKISLKFVPKGLINNVPALVQIMAWRRPGDKPLSEAMMVNLPTHICDSRPQWVKSSPSHP